MWSLPGHSRQANKGHSPRCHCRPNGPGRLTDKVVQPTIQSAEECTYLLEKLTSTSTRLYRRTTGLLKSWSAERLNGWTPERLDQTVCVANYRAEWTTSSTMALSWTIAQSFVRNAQPRTPTGDAKWPTMGNNERIEWSPTLPFVRGRRATLH